MKKLVLLSYILCGFTFLSCSKFLEENPRDQISEEEAYDNATSVYLNTVATLYNYVGGYSDSQGLQGTGMTVVSGKVCFCINGVSAVMPYGRPGSICIR